MAAVQRRVRKPGRPKKPIPRAVFLDAAREVFADDGYGAASVERIASAVGVTKASLLHHFGSKEELYRLTLARIADDLGRLVVDAIIEPGTFFERLDRLGERVVRYLATQPQSARLLVRELVDGGPFLAREGASLVFRALDATTTLLRSGIESGDVVEQDPGHLAGTIVSLHLLWFASTTIAGRLSSTAGAEAVEQRVREVKAQVRRLCAATPPPAERRTRRRPV